MKYPHWFGSAPVPSPPVRLWSLMPTNLGVFWRASLFAAPMFSALPVYQVSAGSAHGRTLSFELFLHAFEFEQECV